MPGTADRFGAAGHIGFCLRRCPLSGGDANHHPNPWKNYELVPIGLLALLALLGYLGGTWLNTASTMLSHRSAFMILKNIRTELTAKLSRVPMGTILDTPSGNFKTLLVDTVEKLELPLAHMIPELTANILIPVLMLLYLFVLDWRIALISLITIPIGLFCYMGMMKDYEKRYSRVLTAGKTWMRPLWSMSAESKSSRRSTRAVPPMENMPPL